MRKESSRDTTPSRMLRGVDPLVVGRLLAACMSLEVVSEPRCAKGGGEKFSEKKWSFRFFFLFLH